jgi:hypothetical protein
MISSRHTTARAPDASFDRPALPFLSDGVQIDSNVAAIQLGDTKDERLQSCAI